MWSTVKVIGEERRGWGDWQISQVVRAADELEQKKKMKQEEERAIKRRKENLNRERYNKKEHGKTTNSRTKGGFGMKKSKESPFFF